MLVWLGKPEIVTLSDDTVLLGHDGWADARYGDFDHSSVTLNDSRLIAELYQAFLLSKSALKHEMQNLADEDAEILQQTLKKAIATNIKQVAHSTAKCNTVQKVAIRKRESCKGANLKVADKQPGD